MDCAVRYDLVIDGIIDYDMTIEQIIETINKTIKPHAYEQITADDEWEHIQHISINIVLVFTKYICNFCYLVFIDGTYRGMVGCNIIDESFYKLIIKAVEPCRHQLINHKVLTGALLAIKRMVGQYE